MICLRIPGNRRSQCGNQGKRKHQAAEQCKPTLKPTRKCELNRPRIAPTCAQIVAQQKCGNQNCRPKQNAIQQSRQTRAERGERNQPQAQAGAQGNCLKRRRKDPATGYAPTQACREREQPARDK